MRLRKGQQSGRRRERKFRDALAIALNETDKDTGQPKLRRIADNLVNAAVGGDSWAIKEVADRVDGKAVQAVDLETDHKSSALDYSDDELLAIILQAADSKPDGGPETRANSKGQVNSDSPLKSEAVPA